MVCAELKLNRTSKFIKGCVCRNVDVFPNADLRNDYCRSLGGSDGPVCFVKKRKTKACAPVKCQNSGTLADCQMTLTVALTNNYSKNLNTLSCQF